MVRATENKLLTEILLSLIIFCLSKKRLRSHFIVVYNYRGKTFLKRWLFNLAAKGITKLKVGKFRLAKMSHFDRERDI